MENEEIEILDEDTEVLNIDNNESLSENIYSLFNDRDPILKLSPTNPTCSVILFTKQAQLLGTDRSKRLEYGISETEIGTYKWQYDGVFKELKNDKKYYFKVKISDKIGNKIVESKILYIKTADFDKITMMASNDLLSIFGSTIGAKLQYSYDEKQWIDYKEPFKVSGNTTIYARLWDGYNSSLHEKYTVTGTESEDDKESEDKNQDERAEEILRNVRNNVKNELYEENATRNSYSLNTEDKDKIDNNFENLENKSSNTTNLNSKYNDRYFKKVGLDVSDINQENLLSANSNYSSISNDTGFQTLDSSMQNLTNSNNKFQTSNTSMQSSISGNNRFQTTNNSVTANNSTSSFNNFNSLHGVRNDYEDKLHFKTKFPEKGNNGLNVNIKNVLNSSNKIGAGSLQGLPGKNGGRVNNSKINSPNLKGRKKIRFSNKKLGIGGLEEENSLSDKLDKESLPSKIGNDVNDFENTNDELSQDEIENSDSNIDVANTGSQQVEQEGDADGNLLLNGFNFPKITLIAIFVGLASFLLVFLLLLGIFGGRHEGIVSKDEYEDDDDDEIIESTNNGGVCSYDVNGVKISDIKVRLLKCEGNEAIEGEELIDFENYILGVVYAEVGGYGYETYKTQAVAARSYALTRADIMGSSLGHRLKKENGTWVLQIRNCTSDQVYCNPDKGCSAYEDTGDTVHSGSYNGYKVGACTGCKGPLPANSDIRKAVAETTGIVAINSSGKIVYTNFAQPQQTYWASLSSSMDYFQILKKTYPSISTLSNATCSSSDEEEQKSIGEFSTWKQCGESWSNIKMSQSRTICNIGCAATSVAIQIARSKTKLLIDDFNPGTFVQTLKNNGKFTSSGAIYWNGVSVVAPNFQYVKKVFLKGSKADKAKTIEEYINQGYYIILAVKAGEGHWVAVDSVSGTQVNIFDPGSSETKLWNKYAVANVTAMHLYKKND